MTLFRSRLALVALPVGVFILSACDRRDSRADELLRADLAAAAQAPSMRQQFVSPQRVRNQQGNSCARHDSARPQRMGDAIGRGVVLAPRQSGRVFDQGDVLRAKATMQGDLVADAAEDGSGNLVGHVAQLPSMGNIACGRRSAGRASAWPGPMNAKSQMNSSFMYKCS